MVWLPMSIASICCKWCPPGNGKSTALESTIDGPLWLSPPSPPSLPDDEWPWPWPWAPTNPAAVLRKDTRERGTKREREVEREGGRERMGKWEEIRGKERENKIEGKRGRVLYSKWCVVPEWVLSCVEVETVKALVPYVMDPERTTRVEQYSIV